MKQKYTVMLSVLLLFFVQISFAQDKTVTGTITDDNGVPLPGVNIIIKNTSSGTQSDFDGNYSITTAVGKTLVFSYVGFETQEVKVSVSNTINVTLKEGALLQEVVITGYSSNKKDVLTSAVSLVTAAEIEELVSTTSVDNLIQGKAAGVQVTAANGKPGATAFVRIRGTTSLTAGASSPLYIVDGAPLDEQDLNGISSNEIESISILKDAATTSIYGSRGSNGVVLITTKKGKKNKDATIKVSSRYGITSKIEDNWTMMNAEQLLRYEAEMYALGVGQASLPGVSATPEERAFLIANQMDWEDRILRQGVVQSNNVSFSGGEEKSDYYLSLGHDRNTGIIDGVSGFERLSGRLNVNFEAKKWLDVGASIGYSRSISDEPRDRNNVQNPFRAMYDYNPYENEFLLDDEGNVLLDENGDPEYNFGSTGFLVTEAIATTPEVEIQNLTLFSTYATAKFSDRFSYRVQFSLNHENFRREYYLEPGNNLDIIVGNPDFPGIKTDNGFQEVDYTISNTLNYNYRSDTHNLNAYGLFEFNQNEENRYAVSSSGFASSLLTTQTNAGRTDSGSTNRERITLLSYGVFANYDYKEKYLLAASARIDASSNFGADNQYGLFYSGSLGWNIAKEDFFDVSWINDFKIRASYGTVGNRGALGNYASQGTVAFDPYVGGSGSRPENIANPNLQWEETAITDVGVELGLFNNRVSAVFDYFVKTTDKLLFSVPAPDESGIPDFSINSNLGKIENKGFEVELSADVVRNDNWKWTVGGNVGFIQNEILELPDNDGDGVGDDIEPNTFNTLFREGEEINAFFLTRYAGLDPQTGRPLYYNAAGEIVTADLLTDDDTVLLDKSPTPDFEGGFFSNLTYKGFGLRTDWVFRGGNYINNFVRSNITADGTNPGFNQATAAFNYWKKPGDTNVLPNPIYGDEAQTVVSDRFLEKGDFIRLRNVTLSYTVPRKYLEKVPFQSFRIYAQGQNLLTFSDFFGDPEVGISSGETVAQGDAVAPGEATLYSYPTLKSVSVGVDITF